MTRVLIADDHPFLCEGVKAVLTEAGMDVVAAVHDGDAALEALERLDPDVAILDVAMPGRDGIATLEAIRERGDKRPVVLLTAHLSDPKLVSAMRAGVNGIVCKQGGSGRLAEAIRIVCQGGQSIPADMIGRAMEAARREGATSDPLSSLTPREREIARAVSRGLRNRAIAESLDVSEGAIKVSLHRIYDKLGVGNRTELALLIQGTAASAA